MSEGKGILKEIPVIWDQDSDTVTTRYATNFAIQHSENEFYLSFYEVRPPLVLGKNEEQIAKQIESIKTIKAKCVGRIAVSVNKMPAIIDAIQENYNNYLQSKAPEESTKE